MLRLRAFLVCLSLLAACGALRANENRESFGQDIRQEAHSRQKGWIVLVYGGDWSPAGARLHETLSAAAFRNAISASYLLGFVDLSPLPPASTYKSHEKRRANARGRGGALETLETPALFAGDKEGELFLVWENVPSDLPAQTLLARIEEAHARQADLKKRFLKPAFGRAGLESANLCGEFLAAMVPFIGSEARVCGEKAYARVWNRLRKLDPKDKTGWQRHFTLGSGTAFVKIAAAYALEGNAAAGAGFLAAERAKPNAHLSVEQRQALEMAAFELCRRDESRREEALALLRKVCSLGYATTWGVAAMGWLDSFGKPPLSIPYGWQPGDISRGPFKMKVQIGVREAFPAAGRYTVSFRRLGMGGVRFDTLELFEGSESLVRVQNPTLSKDESTTTFTFDFYPEYGDMVSALEVTGLADVAGAASCGTIRVSPNGPVRTRKSARPESTSETEREDEP